LTRNGIRTAGWPTFSCSRVFPSLTITRLDVNRAAHPYNTKGGAPCGVGWAAREFRSYAAATRGVRRVPDFEGWATRRMRTYPKCSRETQQRLHNYGRNIIAAHTGSLPDGDRRVVSSQYRNFFEGSGHLHCAGKSKGPSADPDSTTPLPR
jgi:hypothetical protein